MTIDGVEMTAGSYHAPPGASFETEKARQAVTFARWLTDQPGPLLFGADANTPRSTCTTWLTRELTGIPGAGNCSASQEMTSCSVPGKFASLTMRCGDGSPLTQMRQLHSA
jgi:hypothetical protein